MPSTESAAGLRTSEFALPDGVLAVLSWDPYEQLDVARRITALAVAGWVTGLECEVARLREGAADREQENVEPWDVESTEVAGPGHADGKDSYYKRNFILSRIGVSLMSGKDSCFMFRSAARFMTSVVRLVAY
ncbi:hypothetical protein D1007_02191 [Hordeum vulgare]|nr:hypothetical protein D1007_02191 [Hordeum vulgare]